MKFKLLYLFLSLGIISFSQDKQLNKEAFNLKRGLAIQGYDPVSYFNNDAKKGKEELSVLHNDITYLFASEKNLKEFKKNPDQFIPQYGGWCAYAMAKGGKKVDINPKTYKITDGKLYLFYNAYFNNTLKEWNKDEVVLQKDADKNWNSLIK